MQTQILTASLLRQSRTECLRDWKRPTGEQVRAQFAAGECLHSAIRIVRTNALIRGFDDPNFLTSELEILPDLCRDPRFGIRFGDYLNRQGRRAFEITVGIDFLELRPADEADIRLKPRMRAKLET